MAELYQAGVCRSKSAIGEEICRLEVTNILDINYYLFICNVYLTYLYIYVDSMQLIYLKQLNKDPISRLYSKSMRTRLSDA